MADLPSLILTQAMKHILFLVFFCSIHQLLTAQGVSVTEAGVIPHASAMLDIQSTAKGVLIPRMTTAQRTGIVAPATGLLVFDNTTASFWYRTASIWVELTDNFHGLRDADNDTKVQVEQSPDEDIIRFDIGGVEAMVLDESTQGATRLDIGPDIGLIIGRQAGVNSFSGWNTILGPYAGQFNTTGQNNVFVGYRAGEDNAAQSRNVFIGSESGANNVGGFNSFLGYRTGYVNSTGHSNTFLGTEAGVQNTTGYRNTFVGYNSGHNNEVSFENTCIGVGAGYNNEANRNTFLGHEAGMANRTGLYNTILGGEAAGTNLGNRDMGNGNTIVGYEAAQVANGMTENVLFGYRAGFSMTNGFRNIFIGANAGLSTIVASSNIAMGYHALRLNINGNRNLAIGDSSLYSNTGNDNVALGFKSGMDNTTGTSNTFLGYLTGTNNTTGAQNTFVGRDAGGQNTTGSYNTMIGADAGELSTEGSYNVIIGSTAGRNNESGSENVFIGNTAGQQNRDGVSNIAIGANAGDYNDDGNRNIAIGENALGNFTNNHVAFSNSIAIGYNAGVESAGNSNIIIGNESGQSMDEDQNILLGNNIISYGHHNTYLGSYAAASFIPAPSFSTALGYGTTIVQDHTVVLGNESNILTRVGIGTNTPDAKLDIDNHYGDALIVNSFGQMALQVPASGDVLVGNDLLVNTATGKPGYQLSVNGEIVCEEVLVQASEDWPDYVFGAEYALMNFQQLKHFINTNQHLPGIPSAQEVSDQGVKVGDMQKRLLEKVEELTLYILQLEARINDLENK